MSDTAPEGLDDLAAAQARNVELRKQLTDQNAQLEAALTAARGNLLAAAGLSDDDVRRIEHPDEYAHEKFAAKVKAVTEGGADVPTPTLAAAPAVEVEQGEPVAAAPTPQPGESRESFLARVGDAFFGAHVE